MTTSWQRRKATIGYRWLTSLSDEDFEKLISGQRMNRAMRKVYGRALVKELKRPTLLDSFRGAESKEVRTFGFRDGERI